MVWLVCFVAAWGLLSVALGLAVFRHAISANWKDYVFLAGGILVAGSVPLTWLRLNDSLNEAARKLAARMLGHWIGSGLLLAVLVGVAIYAFWSAMQMKHITFQCSPPGLQLLVDDDLEMEACTKGVWTRPGTKIAAFAPQHLAWHQDVAETDKSIEVTMVHEPPEPGWSCELKREQEYPKGLDNCPHAGKWTRSAVYSIKMSRRNRQLPTSVDIVVRARDKKGLGLDFQDKVEQQPCDSVGSDDPVDNPDDPAVVRVSLTNDCIGARRTLEAYLTVCVDETQRGPKFSFQPLPELLEFFADDKNDDRDLHCR